MYNVTSLLGHISYGDTFLLYTDKNKCPTFAYCCLFPYLQLMLNNQVFNILDTNNFPTEITCQKWKKINQPSKHVCSYNASELFYNFSGKAGYIVTKKSDFSLCFPKVRTI